MRTRLQSEIRLQDLRDLANRSDDWAHTSSLLGVAFCLLVYYAAILYDTILSFAPSTRLDDFDCLYASVYAWAHHMNPYLSYPLSRHVILGIQGIYAPAINSNPPISLYLFRPLVFAGVNASAHVWTLVSVVLFLASLALIVRANPNPALRARILLILGMAAVWHTFWEDQIYMVLLFLTVIAWQALRKDNLLTAGVSIGLLCALKPNFLVWPVLLVLARHRKAGISALVTFATVSVVPLAFGNGVQLYRFWAAGCRGLRGFDLPSNSAIFAMLGRLDPYNASTHYYAGIGYALAVGLLLLVAWLAWRRAPDPLRTSAVALVTTLLVGPYSWPGYALVLVPMLYERKLNAMMRVGWVILCIPIMALSYVWEGSSLLFILMGSPYFYGLVLIGFTVLYEVYRERDDRPGRAKGKLALANSPA